MNFELPENLFQFHNFPFFSQNEWKKNDVMDLEMKLLIGNKENASNAIIQTNFKDLCLRKYADFKLLYTDGSKIDNSTTAAFCEQGGCERKFKSSENCTIFSAECMGILKALEHLQESHTSSNKICIITDCMSAILAIQSAQNSFKNHNLVSEICEKISDMTQQEKIIKILWIPSHCSIMGNERADELANDAHDNPDEIVEISRHFNETSHEYYNNSLLHQWKEDWSSSDKGRFCFSIIPKINKVPWYKCTKFTRAEITFWNRIISNHTRSANSLNRFKIVNNPKCSCGENYQTIDHLLFECAETRDNNMEQKLRNCGYHPPWYVRDIIATEIEKTEKIAMKIISEHMTKKLLEQRKV